MVRMYVMFVLCISCFTVSAQYYLMEEIQRKMDSKVRFLDSTKVIELGTEKNKLLGIHFCSIKKRNEGEEIVQFREIQPFYYQLDSVQYIIAQAYRLGATDFNFAHFKNLRILQLCADSLVVFPSKIQKCNSLEKLDVSINRFQKLPSWLFTLPKLKVLVVAEGQTEDKMILPQSVGSNSKLEAIDLHKTKLATIPDGFFGFPELRYLNLSDTDLTEFPEGIKNLKKLEYLNLENTNIKTVPLWLFEMPNLKQLGMPKVGSDWLWENLEFIENINREGKILIF